MTEINWDVSKEEVEILMKITRRASEVVNREHMDIIMDITATHLNGCPLRLQDLLASSDFNFYHDINGIADNINRITGKLENCFLPRFAKGEQSDEDPSL